MPNNPNPNAAPPPVRFLTLPDVAATLNVSQAQAYALVRSGALPAIKLGGRGQWRIEAQMLEEMIQRAYRDTRAFVETHPLGGAGPDEGTPEDFN